MAALATVADFLSSARVLLQDNVTPYRYSDAELVTALNIAIMSARKLRPDMFIGSFSGLPSYSEAAPTTPVAVDDQYKLPFLYFIVGHAQLRDEEDTTDARSMALAAKFEAQLVGIV